MIRNILITFSLLLSLGLYSYAYVDIVYPSSQNLTVNSDVMFFSGNTDGTVAINSTPVKLWENKFFVHTVPLEYGKNLIKISACKNGKSEEKIYTITRNKPVQSTLSKSKNQYIAFSDGILYSKTINNNSTIRDLPSSRGNRIIDLPKDVILYFEGKQGDYYKIKEISDTQLWIHKSNIDNPVKLADKIKTTVNNIETTSDKNYEYKKFHLSYPVMFTLKQTDKQLKLILYGIYDEKAQNIKNAEYIFDYAAPQLGYDCYYEGNTLIFRKAKLPENIDESSPLRGINIFIDAGHGGHEKGTISPERIYEKDINLDIALDLTDMLKASGANVSYSRSHDTKVGLYERVQLAKKNNALISISIHCNSLPLGKNPYDRHGTEVHYYNDNAKMLADIINKNMANDLSIKLNGIHKSNFALTRSTNPVSVLVETAYMIYPSEYILLKNKYFRRNIAKSIKKSLEEYILWIRNNKS